MKSIYQCPCSSISSLPLVLSITYYFHLILFFFNRHDSFQSFDITLRIITALAQSAKEKVIPETKTLGMNTFKTKLGADSA
jgi:hypothetical protein